MHVISILIVHVLVLVLCVEYMTRYVIQFVKIQEPSWPNSKNHYYWIIEQLHKYSNPTNNYEIDLTYYYCVIELHTKNNS